ncbi:putative shikimate O-hydroxycinnamoyltransferase [Lupinus albus]|uniref:Putative shikimate O-hydroxycinnamoyltransferase n=1 Tax=Lupinus albus TaxID=3870 RepID=A0A6A4QEM1_LUPAL|nr:putative shikimate O-hydroxycinnamoyltransferase [Lupinus albus]
MVLNYVLISPTKGVPVRCQLPSINTSEPNILGKSHPLSVLDHAMGQHSLHIIYYYKDLHYLLGSFELDPLRESLCEVLTMYPNMTGRLARGQDGNWEVRYNDAGVRVIMANVDATLQEWLTSANGSLEPLLIVWEDMPEDDPITWSPFRIQINIFNGGGVAIGLSCSHMVADLTCLASFFKSWTETQSHLPITHPPFFTITSQLNAQPVPNTIPNSPSPYSSAQKKNMVTATFNFSSSVIKKCLCQVHNECPNSTPFDFLSALFWSRIARFKPPKNHDQTHYLSICTDFRRRLKIPHPTGYFGNALNFSMVSVKDIDSVGLGDITSLVHKHFEGIESEKEVDKEGKFRAPSFIYDCELTCVCMEHMIVSDSDQNESLMYSAMFSNNEKPVHVSCHVGKIANGEGLIIVMPSVEGRHARTVMVTLPEEQLVELSKDEAILQLEPKVLLACSDR